MYVVSRIRTIKPEFWTSEQVMECSPFARLAFIGMWNFCDDQGVHPASVKTLKAEVFPGDDITAASVQSLIDELLAQGLVMHYEVGGKGYWHVTGWHHQLIKNPSAPKYPAPPPPSSGDDEPHPTPGLPQGYPSPGPALNRDYPSPGPALDPGREGKGKEGKGREGGEPAAAAAIPSRASAAAADPTNPSESEAPEVVRADEAVTAIDRAIELTAMLRRRGASVQASDPRVRAWAVHGVSDAQVLTALETAQQRRADRGTAQPVNAGLIDAILSDGHPARAGPPARKQTETMEDRNRRALAGWKPPELREASG